MVCDKVVCGRECVTKRRRRGPEAGAGGGSGRREGEGGGGSGIQNQEQEPHTKMWGISETLNHIIYSKPSKSRVSFQNLPILGTPALRSQNAPPAQE